MSFTPREMQRDQQRPSVPASVREAGRLRIELGAALRGERTRRGLTLREVAAAAGLGVSMVHAVEAGRCGSIESIVAVAHALRLTPEVALLDSRRVRNGRPAIDPVHAAMGEIEAAHLRALGFGVGLDEPFQHFQFAGRADVTAWSTETAAFLHIENKTAMPDTQDAIGVYNTKRAYLAAEIAARVGVPRWRSETHALVGLWSAEMLHAVRLRTSSIAAACPESLDGFEAWWRGEPPLNGRRSTFVLFDPLEGTRSDRRRWIGLADVPRVKPRYRNYADALDALRRERKA